MTGRHLKYIDLCISIFYNIDHWDLTFAIQLLRQVDFHLKFY